MANRNLLHVKQNCYRLPLHSATYIRHPLSDYSANCGWKNYIKFKIIPLHTWAITVHSPTNHSRHSPRPASPATPPLFTLHSCTLHCQPPLWRPPCIPPLFTAHSPALRSCPSLHRPSLQPFTPPLITLHSPALHLSLHQPSTWPFTAARCTIYSAALYLTFHSSA
jgi:hypothetical protein